jgi:hypothetical protein
MKRFSLGLLTASVAAVLLGGSAQAAPVPWKYNWTPSVGFVDTDSLGSLDSGITLSNEPGVTVNTDRTNITATNIDVYSNAPDGFPDEFQATPDVTFTLKITDLNSGFSWDFLFTGHFNTTDAADPSTVSEGSANVDFTPTGTQEYVKQIGDNEYTIKFISYTPPPPEDADNSGAISYRVTVVNLGIQKAPEPSSMLLAGLGASFMGLGAWRKRRQAAKAEVA